MGATRSVVAATTAAGLALAGSGVGAAASPAGALAAPVAKRVQEPLAELPIAPTMNGVGRTRLVAGKVRTNAAKRAKVMVTATTAKGKPVTTKDFRVARRAGGSVWVWASGNRNLRVRLVLSAPPTRAYTSYRFVKRYVTQRPTRVVRVKGGGPAKDFAKLFGWILEAVAGEIVAQVYGYAVGALFSSDTKGNDLQPVLDQLNRMQDQLNQISAQIDELTKEIKLMNCEIQTTELSKSVSKIEAYSDTLQRLIKAKNKDRRDLDRWANSATDPSQVLTALKDINKIMQGQAGTAGSIRACGASFLDAWTKPLDEAGYYTRLWNYMSYFQQVQMLGATVLTEANHYLAMEAAREINKMPKPVDATKVCWAGHEASNRVAAFCNEAAAVTTEVYWNLVGQTLQAGAGFAWNLKSWDRTQFAEPSISIQKGTPFVWMRDINRYDRVSTQCGPGPINSADRRCGWFTFAVHLPDWLDSNAGYKGWREALTGQWATLLDTPRHDGQRMSDLMESLGFAKDKVNKMIVYTGQYAKSSFDNPWLVWKGGRDNLTKVPIAEKGGNAWYGVCLFDTNFTAARSSPRWPVCADPGGMTFSALMDTYTRLNRDAYRWTPTQWALEQGSNRRYYDGQFDGVITHRQDDFWQKPQVTRQPGWLAQSPMMVTDQYQWPVLDISNPKNYKCTTLTLDSKHTYPLSPKNVAGAYTMCGDDYLQWLKSWLPDPPKASVATVRH